MESMWPEINFDEGFLLPKEILEEQAEEIEKMTNGILYIEVEDLKAQDIFNVKIKSDFAFSYVLRSKTLKNYEFKILSIAHDLNVYPVVVEVSNEIVAEIYGNDADNYFVCDNEGTYLDELKSILGSNTVKLTIQNLYRLSN